jgi:integrase
MSLERHVLKNELVSFSYKFRYQGVSCHTLRHTFASRAVRIADVNLVRVWLGHSSLVMTQRYLHITHDYERSAIELLNEPTSHRRLAPLE